MIEIDFTVFYQQGSIDKWQGPKTRGMSAKIMTRSNMFVAVSPPLPILVMNITNLILNCTDQALPIVSQNPMYCKKIECQAPHAFTELFRFSLQKVNCTHTIKVPRIFLQLKSDRKVSKLDHLKDNKDPF
ncbi:hypothetical protein NHQ30_009077 [Ciborinia camelliae]|nr:hypothetical protein NHQ30_009077 [Ciborinia camelliae]